MDDNSEIYGINSRINLSEAAQNDESKKTCQRIDGQMV
jgi:hypothetical protein